MCPWSPTSLCPGRGWPLMIPKMRRTLQGGSRRLNGTLCWWPRDMAGVLGRTAGHPCMVGRAWAIPGIKYQCKFAWKIRASFYILEVWMRASLEQGYTAPPAPQSLNRSAFLPERLTYQDVHQQPALLTLAYTQSLQHWVEKHNLPRNLDFCPLAESVRELWQTVWEFVAISYQDITQNLEVERPETSHPQPKSTIFSWVLAMPVNEQKTVETPLILFPPLLKMRPYGVPPHPLRLSGVTGICWLLPLQWANWT